MPYSIEQTDAQLPETTARIRYRLTFPQAAQHLVHVEMNVVNGEGEPVVAMPNWIPGSYKVRDFIAYQGDVAAHGPDGKALAMEWIAKNRLRIAAGGKNFTLRYSYFGNERSVRQTHVNRVHAFINPANCLMYVEGRLEEVHHVEIEHGWAHVSTALSPVREDVWGALNYDILADSPIEIGSHFVAAFERHGSMHEVAVTGTGDFDPEWLTEQTKRIVDHAVWMWGSLPYDRYVFIIQLLPGQFGGLEHARSSVNMFDSECFNDRRRVVKLLTLLCHEYFHLWNVKRIRPVELGPFDYNSENYTPMLWLAEGVTSYYDDLISYRCGFQSRTEYLQTLAEDHLGRLQDIPGRRVMPIKESSYLSWVKLYMPTPDSMNRTVSYYLKGGVIFLLLDAWIIAETGGAHRLDDGMRALFARYLEVPGRGVSEEEFIQIVSAAVGVDVGVLLRGWLNTADELPIGATLARIGLEWRPATAETAPTFGEGLPYQPSPPARRIGVQTEEIRSGLKVAKVWRDSPAERAGLGVDDEVIAVNGTRVTSNAQFNAVMRGVLGQQSVRITAASEGVLYDATVQPEARETFELVEQSDMTPEVRALLDRWLQRA
ncbi:MAG TPA: PDZ domain-containing protein [Candidatus Kapabacteria bacterium]|nr:PDZ domain-containing protein [Candidatus Kapabacteria bacterium]